MTGGVLDEALRLLDELLHTQGVELDLVVVGGGAMLLAGLIERPTADLDALARVESERLQDPAPFAPELQKAIATVGAALGLVTGDGATRAWLNAGPSALLELAMLPPGFQTRLQTRRYGSALTIRVASRIDLIYLKMLAATDIRRGARRAVDIQDLHELKTTRDEAIAAGRWVARVDGRRDCFEIDVLPVLKALGVEATDDR